MVKTGDISKWLIDHGFEKIHHPRSIAIFDEMKIDEKRIYQLKDYDCRMRIHVLHHLFWSDNLKSFAIGVYNERGKSGPAGQKYDYTIVMLPKVIYTIEEAQTLIRAITNEYKY